MNHPHSISSPIPHSPHDSHSFQVVEFIERWSLCHHLGFVVKYLTQAGRNNASTLENLKKAQCYLAREVNCNHQPSFSSMKVQPFIKKVVLKDWRLSFHLGEVLFHIQVSQKVHQSRNVREASLRQAMKHLVEEIKIHEH